MKIRSEDNYGENINDKIKSEAHRRQFLSEYK